MGLSYNPTIVPDGLIYYLDAANTRSYSGSGNTIYNLTGFGNDGTLINGVGFTSSNKGSFTFDGSNDVIDLGDNFDMGLASFSFCTYFKANAVSGLQGIFSKSIATNAASRYALFILNSKIYPFMSMGGADVSTPSTLTILANTWYHVGAVYDRTDKLTLFINGNFDSATTITQFLADDFQASHIFRIGSYSDASNNAAYFLSGSIPQLQIYNRALSAAEILQNYNATKSRFGL